MLTHVENDLIAVRARLGISGHDASRGFTAGGDEVGEVDANDSRAHSFATVPLSTLFFMYFLCLFYKKNHLFGVPEV